jgi:hypothetical protein
LYQPAGGFEGARELPGAELISRQVKIEGSHHQNVGPDIGRLFGE